MGGAYKRISLERARSRARREFGPAVDVEERGPWKCLVLNFNLIPRPVIATAKSWTYAWISAQIWYSDFHDCIKPHRVQPASVATAIVHATEKDKNDAP